MYSDRYSGELTKKLAKLRKRDPLHYERIDKKMREIIENPLHEYKNLRYNLSEFKRVQIGHFVLAFRVDHANKTILFYDYDHHDKIYEK